MVTRTAHAEAGSREGVSLGDDAESSTWAQRLQQVASGLQLETIKVKGAYSGSPRIELGITTARPPQLYERPESNNRVSAGASALEQRPE
jgi:hypothetical protein